MGPHVSDSGGVKLGSNRANEVKPAGGSTPARPETAARLGKRPQGTDEAVLGLIGELLQARVEWW